MAEINIERKTSIWPWVIAAAVVLLIIWALFEWNDRDDVMATTQPTTVGEVTPVTPVAPATVYEPAPVAGTDTMVTDATADAAALGDTFPVGLVLADPAAYAGQELSGTAHVTDVPTDRGFWVEQDGKRMFALIEQGPNMEDAINVNTGQDIRITGATVVGPANIAKVEGTLDAEARKLVDRQPAFLLVDPHDIDIVAR